MTTYDNGDLVRLTAAFTTITGTPVDPTSVFLQVMNPNLTVTTYTYGVDISLVKDSTGNYHVDVNANVDGNWLYRFYSTGTAQAAGESGFTVLSSFV